MDDINNYNEKGRTKLMEAADVGDLAMVRCLLSKGASPFMTDKNYGTTTAKMFAGRKAYDNNIFSKIEIILADITGEEVVKKQKETNDYSYEYSVPIYSHTDAGGSRVLLVLGVIVGLPWVVWNYDLNPLSNEISIYPQEYKCMTKTNRSGCEWVNIPYVTYKVNYETQTVLYWSSDKTWSVKKAKNCKVISRKHWTCGGYYKYGFNNGEYSSENTKGKRYMSKTLWWYHNWR